MSKDSQITEMEKQEGGQMRELFSGDRVKTLTPSENRQSWVTDSPTAFPVVYSMCLLMG